MIEIAAIIIATDFIRFACSIVGDAIKTTINKSIELKLEERHRRLNNHFVHSSYQHEDKQTVQESLCANKHMKPLYNKICHPSKRVLYSPKMIYSSDMKPLVVFNSINNTHENSFFKSINEIKHLEDIHFVNTNDLLFSDKAVEELMEVPVILINLQLITSSQIVCDIAIWNIIPGVNNAQKLQLVFDSQDKIDDFKDFQNRVNDYIITIIRTIKDTYYYCRLSLKDSLERLKIESNILVKIGYNNIEFIKTDRGYMTKLSGLYSYDILIFLQYDYPYSSPIMVINNKGNFEEVKISKNSWTPDCTIGQLISSMNNSYF